MIPALPALLAALVACNIGFIADYRTHKKETGQ